MSFIRPKTDIIRLEPKSFVPFCRRVVPLSQLRMGLGSQTMFQTVLMLLPEFAGLLGKRESRFVFPHGLVYPGEAVETGGVVGVVLRPPIGFFEDISGLLVEGDGLGVFAHLL